MDAIFEAAEVLMHDKVDHWLGDVVQVSLDAGPWSDRKCFVFDEGGVLNLAPIDSIDYRVRVKIRREFAPQPSRARFTGGKLGVRVWSVTGDVPENVGIYIVFDISPAGS